MMDVGKYTVRPMDPMGSFSDKLLKQFAVSTQVQRPTRLEVGKSDHKTKSKHCQKHPETLNTLKTLVGFS